MQLKFLNIYKFSDVSFYEALHSYAFHFLMKNNVKHSRQGWHKMDTILLVTGNQ